MKLVQPLFANVVSKWQILDLYLINLNNQGQNTMAFSHKKPDNKGLKAYY